MIAVRRSHERGHAQHGWLDTYHTFSFAGYHDPRYTGFRALRVINEDRVEPGTGFGTHSHRDMEILTYVLEGSLAHKDSMGNGSVIRPGDVQRMTAGTGVSHSEYNHSQVDPVHLLQIWILPERKGLEPGYEQRSFPGGQRQGRLRLIAARDGRDGAVTIHQDVQVYSGLLSAGDELTHRLGPGRHAWVQVARGAVRVNGHLLKAGDGAAVSDEGELRLTADHASELLLFDLA
jgi:hypothetical protein